MRPRRSTATRVAVAAPVEEREGQYKSEKKEGRDAPIGMGKKGRKMRETEVSGKASAVRATQPYTAPDAPREGRIADRTSAGGTACLSNEAGGDEEREELVAGGASR
jgi:hypothetical protein